jgi:hypothetical protein
MKIVETVNILSDPVVVNSKDWISAIADVEKSIIATDWPHGSGSFTIYPESGKKRNQGNGVDLIKLPCLNNLKKFGWKTECLPPIKGGLIKTNKLSKGAQNKRPGDLDALYLGNVGYIGFEWETGNISSSHRAINKLLLTLYLKGLIGGILVVPSSNLKIYLTDRIGNIDELRPYIPLWSSLYNIEAALTIVVVEHDATSFNVPKIPKRTDGRATV